MATLTRTKPVQPTSQAAAQTREPAPAICFGGVLVVDSEPDIRELLTIYLQNRGYRVWTAGDAEEALDVCCDHGGELAAVLLDLDLPRQDALEALDGIQVFDPYLPVCLMTTDPGAHAGLLEGRASHVFTKPFRLEDVGHVLADLIDAHEIQPALAAVSVREHGITRKHGVGQARDVESPRWTRSTVFQRGMHMAKKLYVGNLPYAVTDSDLKGLFAQHGVVQSVQIIFDRDTGRSKGFGFVEFASEREAQAAIDAMNGKEVEGRKLTVNEARPREDRRGQHGASRHAAAGRY